LAASLRGSEQRLLERRRGAVPLTVMAKRRMDMSFTLWRAP
jgi:hypothetical protein